jgi:Fanconi-associated nuclease 1
MVCALYCEHMQAWTGGLPDLMLWRLEPRAFRLVEVKGPGDSLSDSQRAWIDKLEAAGADIFVCHVKAVD